MRVPAPTGSKHWPFRPASPTGIALESPSAPLGGARQHVFRHHIPTTDQEQVSASVAVYHGVPERKPTRLRLRGGCTRRPPGLPDDADRLAPAAAAAAVRQ